ncbi:hypothetical protein DD598_26230, partial [Enterobacter cloacae complex sp. 2DZ2F16B1]
GGERFARINHLHIRVQIIDCSHNQSLFAKQSVRVHRSLRSVFYVFSKLHTLPSIDLLFSFRTFLTFVLVILILIFTINYF